MTYHNIKERLKTKPNVISNGQVLKIFLEIWEKIKGIYNNLYIHHYTGFISSFKVSKIYEVCKNSYKGNKIETNYVYDIIVYTERPQKSRHCMLL
jgi:hypothetical protein